MGFGVQAVKPGMNLRARKWFSIIRLAHNHFAPSEPDYGYWEKKGWHGKKRPWRSGK